ncbi:MAG: hypothetical protein ACKO32_05285 [Planctomycetia bacterium]
MKITLTLTVLIGLMHAPAFAQTTLGASVKHADLHRDAAAIQPLPMSETAPAMPNVIAFGPGARCPCGNIDAKTGCTNSLGVGASLQAEGSTKVRKDDLKLTVMDLPPGALTTLVMGSHPITNRFGDGILLVGNGGRFGTVTDSLVRFPVARADRAGVIAFGPGLSERSAKHFEERDQIQPGDVWFFQALYRDTAGPCGTGMNATNGLAVSFE